ncbi:MAG: Uma2 family endonuclease [Clostridium sp.]|nr:Uma2 family endonuclease [Clostridium sp.]
MIPDINKIYTFKDYLTFPDDKRLEIIEGQIFNMGSPSTIHQELSIWLSSTIYNYIKVNKGACKVFTAPYDVILKDDEEDIEDSHNVVIPDISVICDKNKITDKCCIGSPDMIIEIVSPSNASNDCVRKLNLYEKYKIKEYWIVNPMDKNILVYTLYDNGYNVPKIYTFQDKVKVNIYDNLVIDFKEFDI